MSDFNKYYRGPVVPKGRKVVNPTFDQADYTEEQWQGFLSMLRWNDGPNNPEVKQGGFAREISSKLRPRARPMSREQIEIDHMYPLQSAGSMTNMMRDGEGNFYDADGNFLPPPKPTYDNREFMSARSDIKETAQDLSEMGRYGDTEVVHVNPQEVEMLKKMGGSGTINPQTGLREFFFGFDSFTDAIDGGGKGGSGSEYFSGTHKEYRETVGKNDSRALDSDKKDEKEKLDALSTFTRITGYDDLTDNLGWWRHGGEWRFLGARKFPTFRYGW